MRKDVGKSLASVRGGEQRLKVGEEPSERPLLLCLPNSFRFPRNMLRTLVRTEGRRLLARGPESQKENCCRKPGKKGTVTLYSGDVFKPLHPVFGNWPFYVCNRKKFYWETTCNHGHVYTSVPEMKAKHFDHILHSDIFFQLCEQGWFVPSVTLKLGRVQSSTMFLQEARQMSFGIKTSNESNSETLWKALSEQLLKKCI